MTMFASATQPPALDWATDNQAYLNQELRRLRLLLQRRVLWLRRQWRHDPLQTYQAQVISEEQADWLLAGEDTQAEMRFYCEDGAAAISRSIAELERALNGQRQHLIDAGTPAALEVLVRLFGLTAFERNVLLLCLAPDLDPAFERLYAYVQDEVSRRYATPQLALSLFVSGETNEARSAARDSFLPEAPLRRFRLVLLDPGALPATTLGARPLRLDERIADYLRGINRLDERISDLLLPSAPALLAPSHYNLVEQLHLWATADGRRGRWPALNLMGPTGVGKRAVARALCDRLGVQLYRLDVRRLPPPGAERQEMLRLLEREAILLQTALYVDATEVDRTNQALAVSVGDVIERLSLFLIVGSTQRWLSERELLPVQVPKPDASGRHALWQQALAGIPHSINGQLEAIVQQFDFGPQMVAQAVSAAQGKARLHTPDADTGPTADDLWQACREQACWQLDELVQRILPCYTWEDIVVPEDLFRQLQEIAAQVAHRAQVYETWGFGQKLSRGRGLSALFAGPSGTGKTMAAEVLATHLNLDLYRIDLAGVVSKYIGETEKNLRKVFDAAEQSGAILFFDEADALFGKRTEVKDSHDRYANIEVNYLLQRMEDYRGLAILATNRKSDLDQAFLRRLRFLVDFPFPDADSRRRIWQKSFPPQAPLEQLDMTFLARLEIPGGNIKNIALNAAFLAAGEGTAIGMPQIMRATRREYAKIEKLITETEFGPYYRRGKP